MTIHIVQILVVVVLAVLCWWAVVKLASFDALETELETFADTLAAVAANPGNTPPAARRPNS